MGQEKEADGGEPHFNKLACQFQILQVEEVGGSNLAVQVVFVPAIAK